MKGVIATDHHFGLNKNNIGRLEDSEACIDWIIEECIKSGNTDVFFFLGDLFHDRFELNVLTIEYAQRAIKKLCKAFKDVYLLVGNHDVYYNKNNQLTSTLVLTKKKNLHIIRKEPKMVVVDGQEILLCPWNTRPEEGKKYDMVMGHFEMNGIRQPSGFSSGCSYDAEDISKSSELIFTGHYHINETYEYENSILHSVGSPYQHNWSDSGLDKGIYLMDFETKKYDFLKNDKSPKFVKESYETLVVKNDEEIEKTLAEHKNDFLKIEVDGDFVHDELFTLINKAEKIMDKGIGVEYSDIVNVDTSKMEESTKDLATKSKRDYMKSFMKQLLTDERFKNLKISRLNKLIDVYCEKLEIE